MGQHSFGSDAFGKRAADGTFSIFIAQHWISILDALRRSRPRVVLPASGSTSVC